MIAEPIPLNNHLHVEPAAAVWQPSAPVPGRLAPSASAPSLTLASVTASMQIILAARRAARLTRDQPDTTT